MTPNYTALPKMKGTYIIVAYCSKPKTISVGARGQIKMIRGYYFYVGSAFGPGGLSARLKHHLSPSPKPHWHFDYLKQCLKIHSIWYTCDLERHEHEWAKILLNAEGVSIPVKGLGASDCNCASHFIYSPKLLSFSEFSAKSQAKCDAVNSF